jgi:hypothetical protein
MRLVEESFTRGCAAEAGNAVRAPDLTLEFVVVGEFLICVWLVLINGKESGGPTLCDVTKRVDDDPFALFHCDDLGCAVGHATVVDESRNAALFGRINDSVLVDSEKVTASDAALEVAVFAEICNLLSDFLTNVFDDHVVRGDILHGVQPPVVDC